MPKDVTPGQQHLFASEDVPLAELLPASPFILTHLDVYNWGPFHASHCAEIDVDGSAIIGPTGSGKTTLVDAFMTLLTAQPKYNLASTGGHESDRDLVSYVRGVAGAGNDSGDNEHIARPGKTVTAIAARFAKVVVSTDSSAEDDDKQQTLQVAAIFSLDGSSSAAADLKRLWIFSSAPQHSLADWLELHRSGGARAVKQRARTEEGVSVYDSKKAYLAQLRRFFEVGDNAFTLLNRAAGLKQLNSIDEIFRELVLDDHSAFQRAAEVAAEFDDLAAIHEELQTARRQQQSLLPIDKEFRHYRSSEQQQQQTQTLLQCLPMWYAKHAQRLWQDQCQQLQTAIAQCQLRRQQLAGQLSHSESQKESLRDLYLQAGGASIEQLQELIRQQTLNVATRRRHADDYQKLARLLQLDDDLSSDSLARNQASVASRQAETEALLEQEQQQFWELGASRQLARSELEELQREWQAAQARPDSNIPHKFLEFKALLADELGLTEEDLPYVAELVQVKSEQSHWRGAIERAMGSQRLRLLVPTTQMSQALAWVNRRHNRLHVRLLDAKAPSSAATFFDDGFTRKLDFKAHPQREVLKQLLASIDRHCVDSPEALRERQHAMTEQGLMSGTRGQFDKQDQRRLDQDWMTGFDNKDRLALLQQQIADCEQRLTELEQSCQRASQQLSQRQQQLQLLQQLAQLRFDDIDLLGEQHKLDQYRQRLQLLQDPNSDVEKARRQWQEAEAVHKDLQRQEQDNAVQLAQRQKECDEAERQLRRAQGRLGDGLSEVELALVEAVYRAPVVAQLLELDDLERQAAADLQRQLDQIRQTVADSERQLSLLMERAQKVDTGALAEAGSELRDINTYLERLQLLTEEALPEKLQRFLDYLNHSSDQGVTQLLSNIDNEVTIIEERIEDLNETMRRVDFQPGRYLRLEPRRVVHESLRTLQSAQRHLRTAALQGDDGETHYRALANMVELLRDASDRKKTVGSRALLDPRYRLQFAVAVIERDTGAVIETRTGSQGGSGGEKEIIASYILTASLSYALCPDGSSRPLFGTIVLDEAFSKSSQAVAGRIISALREFGLHPLFITPNKEMRLLRSHTRSAVLIHRRGLRATMTSLSWEELEQHAQQRLTRR